MKTQKLMILAVLAAVIALSRPAQAGLVLGPTTVQLPGAGAAPDLSVDYFVTLCGGTYTYFFVLTPPPGGWGVSSFTVDIADTAIVSDISSSSPAYVPPPVVDNGVSVTWNFNNLLIGVATNSFQSQVGPGDIGMSSATSISGEWVDAPAPAPVPESSTIIAGTLMLLPLGVGIFRALRKTRDLNDLRLAAVPGLPSPLWANVPNTSENVPPADRRETFHAV